MDLQNKLTNGGDDPQVEPGSRHCRNSLRAAGFAQPVNQGAGKLGFAAFVDATFAAFAPTPLAECSTSVAKAAFAPAASKAKGAADP